MLAASAIALIVEPTTDEEKNLFCDAIFYEDVAKVGDFS